VVNGKFNFDSIIADVSNYNFLKINVRILGEKRGTGQQLFITQHCNIG
jgi:hypothetical protein